MNFGGESGLRKVGLGGTHPLTRRYAIYEDIMKNTNFLYGNFWLWFPFWILLLIVALFTENDLIEGLAASLLLMCLAAMATFHNMDINEKKKKSREELDDYIEFLEIISSRYLAIRKLCDLCNEVTVNDSRFTRGLQVPELTVTTLHTGIKYSKYNFLIKAMLNQEKMKGKRYKALDVITYTDLELRYHNLMSMIEKRNCAHNEIMKKISGVSPYGGEEFFYPNFKEFSQIMSFYELSSFLEQTEKIIIEMNYLIFDYQEVTEHLKNSFAFMFSPEAVREFGGIFEVPLYEDKLKFSYVELSETEVSVLKGSRYPNPIA
ncbi:hypothetical protein [Vibrio vulnificus]